MRPTTNEYVIGFDSDAKTTRDALTDFAEKVTIFAKLTNRAPRLGDFVPTDEDGNVLKEPNASMEKYNHTMLFKAHFNLDYTNQTYLSTKQPKTK